MYLPSAVTKHAEIDAAIQLVQQSIGADVVRIRYEIGEDWSGQWAIFFRIVLKDDAARRRLRGAPWCAKIGRWLRLLAVLAGAETGRVRRGRSRCPLWCL